MCTHFVFVSSLAITLLPSLCNPVSGHCSFAQPLDDGTMPELEKKSASGDISPKKRRRILDAAPIWISRWARGECQWPGRRGRKSVIVVGKGEGRESRFPERCDAVFTWRCGTAPLACVRVYRAWRRSGVTTRGCGKCAWKFAGSARGFVSSLVLLVQENVRRCIMERRWMEKIIRGVCNFVFVIWIIPLKKRR